MPGTSLVASVKWALFRLIERLSDLRGNSANGALALRMPAQPMASMWVFVSTIGELNAIDPLLRDVVARCPGLTLVLISEHTHYRDSYLARYPAAEFCVTRGHSHDAATLATHYPPRLLIVAEIPCWPSDAPCRFSFAFLRAAQRARARIALVNAWLYRYPPPSRMDAIERRLFQRDYLRAFDAIGVQTDEMRAQMLAAGADAARMVVTGNIKFDAMQQPDWSPTQARSPVMLGALLACGRPTVISGCVTNFAEQQMVLDAFATLRAHHPTALLILAPRHPEVRERMTVLSEYLAERLLPALFRSSLADEAIAADCACLVLDTMGELRDFYAAATVAHVGVDHNVLEPMGYGKPVTVTTGWNETYPSFPVYRLLIESQALIEVTSADKLAELWRALIEQPGQYADRVQRNEAALAQARGAVQRHLELLAPCLPKNIPQGEQT